MNFFQSLPSGGRKRKKAEATLFTERLPPCVISNPWIYRPEPCPLRLSGSFPWSWTAPLPIGIDVSFSSCPFPSGYSFHLHLACDLDFADLGFFPRLRCGHHSLAASFCDKRIGLPTVCSRPSASSCSIRGCFYFEILNNSYYLTFLYKNRGGQIPPHSIWNLLYLDLRYLLL